MADPTALRHALHASAATAFEEHDTAALVLEELKDLGAAIVATDVAGTGLLARIDGPDGSRAVLLRAELDALPLDEDTGAEYAGDGAHHACGHDGHMAMLLGALHALHALRALAAGPPCTVWALFQPAEETGEGMPACLEHPEFPDDLDAVLSFHNVPGHALGTVLVREGIGAVASTGLVLRFAGSTSHAAEPQHGRNPIPVVGRLAQSLALAARHGDEHAVSALVQIGGGAPRFGTSAGDAMIAATLRAGTDEALEAMLQSVIEEAEQEARSGGFGWEVERVEPFPATMNDADIVAAVRRAADAIGAPVEDPGPFPWSEDFGHASARWPGALVGLGSGTDQPALHSPAYDFPDDLLPTGTALWVAIVKALAEDA